MLSYPQSTNRCDFTLSRLLPVERRKEMPGQGFAVETICLDWTLCISMPSSRATKRLARTSDQAYVGRTFSTAPLPGPTVSREISACSKPKAPMRVVRMSFRTFSFHPSRNRCRTGSRGSLCPSSHQRPDTLPSQRSAGHILSISALYTCAITTAAGLTMQSDGKFFTVRIRYLVKSVLQCTSAGFSGVLCASFD